MLVAEEKPVAARGTGGIPVGQEGPEGRNARTRTDHDDVPVFLRQAEAVVRVNIEFKAAAFGEAGKVIRAKPVAQLLVDAEGIARHGEVHFAAMRFRRGS